MPEEVIRPIDEQTAKAVEKTAETIGKAVDTIRASGGYVSEIPGHLPHNFIGRFDDRVAHKRRMRALTTNIFARSKTEAQN